MKFSSAIILAATASVASASIRATADLLSKARSLQNDPTLFLEGYSAKLIGCATGASYTDSYGNIEPSSVIFRLCPANTCVNASTVGCKKGYGDYVTGINTYVQAYVNENINNLMNDDFNPNMFSACRQYNYQPQDDTNAATPYYIGPACAGTAGLKLDLFTDDTCTTPADSSITYASLSGGKALPYSQGNLVSTQCASCNATANDGSAMVSNLCSSLYQTSGHCETYMQKNSSYGYTNDVTDCKAIASISKTSSFKSSSGGGHAGAAIGWVIFALVSK
jgi:hypothetical protein